MPLETRQHCCRTRRHLKGAFVFNFQDCGVLERNQNRFGDNDQHPVPLSAQQTQQRLSCGGFMESICRIRDTSDQHSQADSAAASPPVGPREQLSRCLRLPRSQISSEMCCSTQADGVGLSWACHGAASAHLWATAAFVANSVVSLVCSGSDEAALEGTFCLLREEAL